jgi:hypothetical protein
MSCLLYRAAFATNSPDLSPHIFSQFKQCRVKSFRLYFSQDTDTFRELPCDFHSPFLLIRRLTCPQTCLHSYNYSGISLQPLLILVSCGDIGLDIEPQNAFTKLNLNLPTPVGPESGGAFCTWWPRSLQASRLGKHGPNKRPD